MNEPTYTQSDVNSIVRRAKELGAGDGLDYKNGHLQLSIYGKPHGAEVLAMLIVNGWHDKYDLIYATQAVIEHFQHNAEQSHPIPQKSKPE